jgi:hypothetical protein
MSAAEIFASELIVTASNKKNPGLKPGFFLFRRRDDPSQYEAALRAQAAERSTQEQHSFRVSNWASNP